MTDTAAPARPAAERSIDSLDPRLYDDPWEVYAWLRDHDPVHWDVRNDLWVVSRHEHVSHVSRKPELYCAGQGVRPRVVAPMSIISMDDPEHSRQRRIISKGFTPRRVRELTDHIRELSDRIIDEVAERGRIDFVEDFAIHVPLIVIAELMGLDVETRDKLYHWSDAMMAGEGHTEPDDPVMHRATEAFGEYVAECQTLIEARRREPTDDIISVLTGAFDEGELENTSEVKAGYARQDLSDDDLLMFLTLLVVAGNETTRNAIAGGLLAFSAFPDQKAKLLEDPSLMDTAVDEIVRFVSPVLSFSRTATEDHELEGRRIRAGDKVLMLYQSANRDPRAFEDPDEFRVDRSPNNHLGFGVGTHYCLGANLAKAEIKVVFEQLFARLPDVRVPDDHRLERGDSSLVLAIEHVPAVFTPTSAS